MFSGFKERGGLLYIVWKNPMILYREWLGSYYVIMFFAFPFLSFSIKQLRFQRDTFTRNTKKKVCPLVTFFVFLIIFED